MTNSVDSTFFYALYSRTGVSNSNPLTGRISYQKCSAGHTLKEKWLCRPQFLEEALKGHYLFIFISFLTTFLPKQHKNSNISIQILITYIFERAAGRIDILGGPRVWDPCSRTIFLFLCKSFSQYSSYEVWILA